ncbi:MAG: winged helix-turn-helix domain-containing protein [Alphaproteobacteria bacterium]
MPRRRTQPSAPAAGGLALSLRLRLGNRNVLGPGKIALLQSIAECGSITGAAKQLGMSYRRAWLLVDAMNESFKAPLVASSHGGLHGGGATLTDEGEAVLRHFQAIERKAQMSARDDKRAIERLMRAAG